MEVLQEDSHLLACSPSEHSSNWPAGAVVVTSFVASSSFAVQFAVAVDPVEVVDHAVVQTSAEVVAFEELAYHFEVEPNFDLMEA